MNLRHIDPGSTDWMDAMLEGEPQSRRKREAAVGEKPEAQNAMAAAGRGAAPPRVAESPPPLDGGS